MTNWFDIMSADPSHAYLETQVLTATPQRLRLMLIEGAIRYADQTARFLQDGSDERALESLIRCRDFISELIAGIRPDASSLAKKVLGLYTFLFQALTEAQLSRDAQKLAHVRRVLESERDTWQQLCQQLPDAPLAEAAESAEIVAPAFVPIESTVGSASQLSLEA